ncbi:hypothetical protein ACJJIQ_19710 [Microbulbifer sp. ANSA003]|uniref:hypothetical protein n=1 Tax=Microbulbifer sp. ANSA003 TaxID=3243360 RepID=UPI0040428E18
MFEYRCTKVMGLITALVLSGCWNKGEDSNDRNSNIPKPDNYLYIQGGVIDGLPTGTKLEVLVGDNLVYTTIIDRDRYSVEINLDKSNTDGLVKLIATSETNKRIKLVSTLGFLHALQEDAGSDRTLVYSENKFVQISGVSTAISATLDNSTNESSEWNNITRPIEASEIFAKATMIKMLVELSQIGVAIPSDVQDTFQLASDFNLSSKYISFFRKALKDIYQEVQADIYESGEYLHVIDKNLIADTYYVDSGILTLNVDGTGEYIENGEVVDLVWKKTQQGVDLESDSSIVFTDTILVEGQQIEFERHRQINGISWMFNSTAQSMFVFEVNDRFHYPSGELQDYMENGYESVSGVRASNLVNPRDLLSIGELYSMPMPNSSGEIVGSLDNDTPRFNFRAVEVSFSGDFSNGGIASIKVPSISASGEALYTEISATWQLDNNRINLDFSDGSSLKYSILSLSSTGFTKIHVIHESEQEEKRTYSSYVLEKEGVNWSDIDIPGIYTYPLSLSDDLSHYFYDFSSDGTLVLVSVQDLNLNGSIEDGEYNEVPAYWSVNDSGYLVIRVYQGTEGYCLPGDWDADDSICTLNDEISWDLYQIFSSENFGIRQARNSFCKIFSYYTNRIKTQEVLLKQGDIDNIQLTKVAERPFKK